MTMMKNQQDYVDICVRVFFLLKYYYSFSTSNNNKRQFIADKYKAIKNAFCSIQLFFSCRVPTTLL